MEDTMNTVNETAISSEPETQQEANDVKEPDTEPQVQEADTGATAQPQDNADGTAVGQEQQEPFLEIKYLKEMVPLSREEAKNYAEIGRRYSDVREQLERVATLKGQSVEEFLKGLETAEDEAYRQELLAKFGNDTDTVEKMMELYSIQKQKKLDAAKESRKRAAAEAEQSVNERIANEFAEMKNGDFPELTEYKALPAEVKKAAIEGMSLSHAYLKYLHRENKKIAAAKESAAEAAKKTTGSMGADSNENLTEDEKNFLKGLWGK